MPLSVFDIFKVGIGPSSSHTMGPMVAAARFLDLLRSGAALIPGAGAPAGVTCRLYGSLALTGKGHATDRAVILGLAGFRPDRFDLSAAEAALRDLRAHCRLTPDDLPPLRFDPQADVIFDHGPALPGHPNALRFQAMDARGALHADEVYYSIGGGFVLTDREMADRGPEAEAVDLPHPFATAAELLERARAAALSIADVARANERARSGRDPRPRLHKIWSVMEASVEEGLATRGVLPGGLNLRRRAAALHDALLRERGQNLTAPHTVNDWIGAYAMAVNEVNAAGGQIVTAPTNGAAGVVPAVLTYYLRHVPGAAPTRVPDFLLTAAAIGALIKTNASISGAEVGCQGEVGAAAAMAAAGLCAVLGGTPAQCENAAEIALEHHLGMTCDPIRGLVQAPCIERNGLGAVKAVAAASLALRGDGRHLVSLDACIETMRQTGRDMDTKYKETSQGGLAVNVPEC
ncbi:MAG: L-serine ammonia-lyase [Pseudomonadota bacterium]